MYRNRLAPTALALVLAVSPTLSRGETPTPPGRDEANRPTRGLERGLDDDPCNTELLRSLTLAKWQGVWGTEPELRRPGYRELALLATDLVSRDPRCENQVIKMSAEIGGADYPAALETSLDALIEDPTCWQVHLFRGQVLTKLQQYSEALQALQLALGVVDSESQRLVWQAVGYIHEKRREYAEAEAAYRNAGDLAAVRRATDPVITEEHWPHDTPFLPPPVLRRADPNSREGLRAREAEQHLDRNRVMRRRCEPPSMRASCSPGTARHEGQRGRTFGDSPCSRPNSSRWSPPVPAGGFG